MLKSAADKAGKAGKTGRGSKKQLTLTQVLAQFLAKTLLPDLKNRAKDPAVNAALMRQWQAEKAAHRTADGFPAWETRTLEQVGAAWVLSCVFVRTLEDRDLLGRRRIAGPGAADSEQLFFEVAPSLTARDYLLTVFREVASLPGAEDLLGPARNLAWRLSPSNEAARALLDFFKQQAGQGATDAADTLVWRFDGNDTRFLGDLYQDLSEEVRKRYALLQTPDFVERFILDQTLEPAIAEFGLENVRLIDPTCGSGHFLLGAFDRLLSHRRQAAPAIDVRDHALAALAQVYGVDLNPYAVAIARFRLTLVYLQRTGITKVAQAPRLRLNLVVADSLLHGAKNTNVLFAEHETAGGDYKAWDAEMFALDDPQAARRVFGQRYHAVVGNPPYITCKDAALRDGYREFYTSCYRGYALSAPFTERFFQLAADGGFVGLINANSFMKREFGKALIEQVLPHLDLTRVVDTSGAYIPGHGTPTVILFGRNRQSVSPHVAAVMGRRGEPTTPDDASQGLVWRSIADHGEEVGFENDYVSVANVPRKTFDKHPWSLGGGGASDLKGLLEGRAEWTLADVVKEVGFGAVTREDELYLAGRGPLERADVQHSMMRPLVAGENVRDWAISGAVEALWPYDPESLLAATAAAPAEKFLWRWRSQLKGRVAYGLTQIGRGLKWFEYSMFFRERFRTPLSIAFAFVATHNHFVLDRGGKVFNRTAPIIKLPESASEEDHLALLAYLNSSTACFWMKQVFMNKGATSDKGVLQADPEKFRFEFDGTKLKLLPVPEGLRSFRGGWLVAAAKRLDSLAAESSAAALERAIARSDAGDVAEIVKRTLEGMADAQARMVALQEELDWVVYELMDLLPAGHPAASAIDAATLGSLGGCDEGSRPYRKGPAVVEGPRAEDLPLNVALIEVPEFKRRWFRSGGKFDGDNVTNEDLLSIGIRAFLLDEMERRVAGTPRQCSVRKVVSEEAEAPKSRVLAALLWDEASVQEQLSSLIEGEMVPFASAASFTNEGAERHAQWQSTWALQRREDRGEAVGDIPIPPKYDQKDYRDATFWRLRGKLDVPKERFISYPGCEKDGDPSPLIGWAGWNHLQRAQALVALYQERKNEDGWSRDRLMPMLVGLHELMFWLELWHSQPDAGSQNPAREFKQFLDAELHAHALTTDDLEAWRPPVRKSSARRGTTRVSGDLPEAPEDGTEGVEDTGVRRRRSKRRKADIPIETT